MKRRSLILSCVMVFCLMVGVLSAGAQNGYNITLEATTDGSTVSSVFPPGNVLFLNINLDAGSAGVAGCAFTLEWTPADALTAPVTNADGTSADISSIFPFETTVDGTDYETHRENASSGKIYFAGAEVTSLGGAKTHPYDVTLFTAKFTVNATASGTITFTLKQTQLLNEAAGWGVNGAAEGVPIIVGAYSNEVTDCTKTTDTGCIDGFGGNLSDDFPVMLENFTTNPTLVISAEDGAYPPWAAQYADFMCPGETVAGIGGPEEDCDRDGFTNDQERLNGTDPTLDTSDVSNVDVTNPSTWTSVGTNYNALTDFRVSNLDIDGNGKAELTTDAVLLYRHLQNQLFPFPLFDDAALIDGAVASDCTRCTASTIKAYIDAVNEAVYDVDGSGKPTLTTDAVLIYRHIQNQLFPFPIFDDVALLDGAVDEVYCTRCTADEIKAYINLLFPGNN